MLSCIHKLKRISAQIEIRTLESLQFFTFSNDACLSLDEKLRAALVNTNIRGLAPHQAEGIETLQLQALFLSDTNSFRSTCSVNPIR